VDSVLPALRCRRCNRKLAEARLVVGSVVSIKCRCGQITQVRVLPNSHGVVYS
jgi:phage FluMu protein Com